MSENLKYWLWLQRALGEGAHINKIIEDFGSAKALYDANILEWRMSTALTAKQVNKLEETDINSVNEIIYTCRENNWQIIDYDDKSYPKMLKEIVNPPAVLYVDGELPDFDKYASMAIVGTRNAGDYAVKVTHIMSRGVADAGAVVVSGGALGVDTAAHRGALVSGGKTVAVLGCGFGTNYLNENRQLRDTIKQNGALVTEYPPYTRASRTTFPMRNRIISGLSLGVLVVEAGVKSGSLITANLALEQGRDVYAVPASVLSLDFAGTNKLIDDGATVVTKPVQLVEPYAYRFDTLDTSKVKTVDEYVYGFSDKNANIPKTAEPDFNEGNQSRKERLSREKQAQNLSGDADKVFRCLEDSFSHIDIITEKTGLSTGSVVSALTQLEIMGLAESASGKRYKKI
ncbi:MAG: DNA-processing protein DprA [Eubacterium sp.]